MALEQDYVTWFRNSSPYINAHRGKTFVVMIPGEAIANPNFTHTVHDLALLNSLGIRLVLVHGARQQISAQLAQAGIESAFNGATRITDAATMEIVARTVGQIRLQIEGAFSAGLANSPMHNARIQATSGNFVMARPIGVHEGKDYQYTGTVRRVAVEAIEPLLSLNHIVLLSSVAASITGELFNINAEEVAAAAATALKADKIIYLTAAPILNQQQDIVRELTSSEASTWPLADAAAREQLMAASRATEQGVDRAHLVGYHIPGGLLQELFTHDGCGTLVSQENYETLRQATIDDVGGILALIRPLEEAGVLVRRSRERLEQEISQFSLLERDGMVLGCAALYPLSNYQAGEVACVAVHPNYRNGKRGHTLLAYVEKKARTLGMQALYTLTTQTAHWFMQQGFEPVPVTALPGDRQALYNFQRNSKVFRKIL